MINNIRGKPVVFLDRDFEVPDIPIVSSDHYAGAYQLGTNLGGAEEILFLAGNLGLPSMQARLKGMRDGLEKIGHPLNEDHTYIADHSSHSDGYALMKQLLATNASQIMNHLLDKQVPELAAISLSLRSSPALVH